MTANGSILRKVGDRLAKLVTEDNGPGQNATGGTSNKEHHTVAPLSREDFERHLRTVSRADQSTPALAGRVNFIGLTKIREKLGDKWTSVAERADEIARRAIERRLTSVDVYTRYKDLQYLIVFAQLSKEQGQLKCALIAEEINKRLLGEDTGSDLLEIKTMVSQLDGDLKFEDVPSVDALAAALADDNEGASTKPTTESEDEDAWWKAENDPAADPLAGLQLVYRPMWDVRRNAITTYVCVPAMQNSGGRLRVGESEIPRLNDPAVAYRLDLMVQRRVISDLRKTVAKNERLLFCLPIHFETLAVPARRNEYGDLCRRGIPPAGQKLLVFELTGVPDGVSQTRLLEFSTALKGFGRGMLMRTTVTQNQFRPSAETGIAGIGFEHASHDSPESRQIQDFGRFAASAKKLGLSTYVHGLKTVSLTTAAIGAGFDFVDGEVVTSVVGQPRQAYSYGIADFYAAKLPATTD